MTILTFLSDHPSQGSLPSGQHPMLGLISVTSVSHSPLVPIDNSVSQYVHSLRTQAPSHFPPKWLHYPETQVFYVNSWHSSLKLIQISLALWSSGPSLQDDSPNCPHYRAFRCRFKRALLKSFPDPSYFWRSLSSLLSHLISSSVRFHWVPATLSDLVTCRTPCSPPPRPISIIIFMSDHLIFWDSSFSSKYYWAKACYLTHTGAKVWEKKELYCEVDWQGDGRQGSRICLLDPGPGLNLRG